MFWICVVQHATGLQSLVEHVLQGIVDRGCESVVAPAVAEMTVEEGTDEADDDFAPYAARAKARGWRVVVMKGGHVPVGTEWGVLARLLGDLPERPALVTT